MNGLSVFLGEDIDQRKIDYLHKMQQAGFKGIFTSLHIPEEDATLYFDRLKILGKHAQELKMKLMVDISGEALAKAGFSFEKLDQLLEIGVTGLRMDYAISNQKIAQASKTIDIGLNASTITLEDLQELKQHGADFERFEAWHNYYPRPETGLSDTFLVKKNSWLKKNGIRTFAFIPGNQRLRGPLKEGLPTLEQHRYVNPLAAAIELKESFCVDAVYIGDPEIDDRTINQFSYHENENILLLEVESSGSDYYSLILGNHVNRKDDARDVIRSAEARFKVIPEIVPEKAYTNERNKGSVTIDNQLYERYMGEIQLTKHDLEADPKVTVVATVVEKDHSLIKAIHAGKKFRLVESGQIANEFRKPNDRTKK